MGQASVDDSNEFVQAAVTAKAFIEKLFQDENIDNVELEEIRPPEGGKNWQVTIGFNRRRPLNEHGLALHLQGNAFVQAAAAAAARPPRVYKVVEVDLAGPRGVSITNRKDD